MLFKSLATDRTMLPVCALSQGFALAATEFGTPAITNGLGDYAKILEPQSHPDWVQMIESWQSQPDNDCLRARGDVRWIAASRAAMLLR